MVLAAIRSPGAIALIGAIAGVLGGVLGALAGGWSTYRIEAQRQRFERRRNLRAELRDRELELAAVRGAARIWRTRLDDYLHLMNNYALSDREGRDRWWADEYNVDVSIPIEDMKAVAAALSSSDWEQIDVGLSVIRSIEAERQWWLAREAGKPVRGTEMDIAVIRSSATSLEDAIRVLDELSGRLPQLPDDSGAVASAA